ncbi:MAG TPA: tetratricopeptide repeat protein [Vicinamibacterales bacterium]|nr:tetratricopeptide repeat protein [Vicinamibacterales bacterium]
MRRTRRHHRREAGRSPVGGSTVRFRVYPVALIVCAVVLVYWNALDTPFIWDDRTAIVNNPTLRSLWPPWNALVPPLDTPVSRRPLVNLTFALNYGLHGLQVRGYHVVNLGFHALAACLLFAIVRRTLASPSGPERLRPHAPLIALSAALLWALHPIASEIVNYTTQRTSALAGLLFLLTLYAAQRALDIGHRRRWQVVAVGACACGMVAKEFVAIAPLVVVLYDRAFAFGSIRQAMAARRTFYGALATTWVLLGAVLLLRPHSTAGFSAGVSVWTYALNQTEIVLRYLRLAFWPDALVLDYGLPRAVSLVDVWPSLLTVAALLSASVIALSRWPRVGFLCAVFFLVLAPTSSIVPIATEVAAERRMYLPLAALATLAAVAAAWLLDREWPRVPDRFRSAARLGAFIVVAASLAALAFRTVDRNEEFETRVGLWRTSIERWPQGRARMSYATALLDAQQPGPALRQLRLAVLDYPRARFALGNELAAQGRYDEAAHELAAFVAAEPLQVNRARAQMLRAQIFARQGRIEDALAQYGAIVKRFPSMIEPRVRFADALLTSGRAQDAIAQYRTLLERQPDQVDWLVRLGHALAASGGVEGAAISYRRALAVNPRAGGAQVGLAGVLLDAGRFREGGIHAEAALALDPRNAAAHNLLGVARAMEGRLNDAVAHFRAAIAIDPRHQQALGNLARAERQLAAGAPEPAPGRLHQP